MAQLLTTQPYGQYHASNSKEYMSLRNAAITNFKPDQTFELETKNANDYLSQISENGQSFCFLGLISRVPTECDIDAADANQITYREKRDIINTFDAITMDHVQKNATMLWGNKTWTTTDDKEICDPTTARDELTTNGQALTATGKALLLKRFQSQILAAQCLKSLNADGRKALRVEKSKYEWCHPTSGELVCDGLTVLHIIITKLRPNKLITAYDEITKIKKVLPASYKNDMARWDTAFEAARINIELLLPGEYSDTAFKTDYLNAALTVQCKSFTAEVSSIKTQWQLGTSFPRDTLRSRITQMYVNFEADGTWARELGEVNQIIALTTQVRELSNKMKDTVALATGASSSTTAGAPPSTGRAGRHNGGAWTVAEWRLKYDGDSKKSPDGHMYHWCKEDHWSGGKVHNGMYARHEPGKHKEWRAEMDERREKSRKGTASASGADSEPATSSTQAGEATKKKLALAEQLRTALATQAGLSQDAFTKIWDDSCKASGNA